MTDKQQFNESRWRAVDVIARVLNLSPRRVQQLAKEGHIPQGRRGMYEFVPTVQGYCQYLQNLVAGRNGTASAYTAEILKERAAKLRWENEVAAEQVIPAHDVTVGIQVANDYIRSKLLAIPADVAQDALAAESVGDVKLVLQEAIHNALDEIARTRFVPASEDDAPATKKPRRRGPAT